MKKKKQLMKKKSSKKMNPSDNASKIFESISKMDLEALVVLLDEDININDTPCKYTLLGEMKEWFDIFKSKGDTYLNQSEGKCMFIMCSDGDATRIFIGNQSGHKYSLKYKLENNDIIELMQCNYSEGDHAKVKQK
jgi:hypothetical protein